MANHQSAIKRIRSNRVKMLRNKYQHKTTRTYIKRLRACENKEEAQTLLITVTKMLDKLAKRNIIHQNKASNQKSRLSRLVAQLN